MQPETCALARPGVTERINGVIVATTAVRRRKVRLSMSVLARASAILLSNFARLGTGMLPRGLETKARRQYEL